MLAIVAFSGGGVSCGLGFRHEVLCRGVRHIVQVVVPSHVRDLLGRVPATEKHATEEVDVAGVHGRASGPAADRGLRTLVIHVVDSPLALTCGKGLEVLLCLGTLLQMLADRNEPLVQSVRNGHSGKASLLAPELSRVPVLEVEAPQGKGLALGCEGVREEVRAQQDPGTRLDLDLVAQRVVVEWSHVQGAARRADEEQPQYPVPVEDLEPLEASHDVKLRRRLQTAAASLKEEAGVSGRHVEAKVRARQRRHAVAQGV
mmetsp:Transcript_76736/g.201364  ORF Transcript_76736/g.201364 Transcript_76736/m.201364 type:complete len:259 (+) Transcript_76736:556-1332(+)